MTLDFQLFYFVTSVSLLCISRYILAVNEKCIIRTYLLRNIPLISLNDTLVTAKNLLLREILEIRVG